MTADEANTILGFGIFVLTLITLLIMPLQIKK